MTEPDVFAHELVERAIELLALQPPKPRAAPGKRFRHSAAGNCRRALAFAALDQPETNPPDLPSLWIMRLGTIAHDDMQAAWSALFPDLEAERTVEWEHGAGSADGASPHVTVELKTVSPASFDLATGIWRDFRSPKRKQPKGPSVSHVLQLCLNAHLAGSSEATLIYLCREPVGRRVADLLHLSERDRFRASWTFHEDEIATLANAEMSRVRSVLAKVDGGVLPARTVPDSIDWHSDTIVERIIANPATETFPCGYCPWQRTCVALPLDAKVSDLP